MPNPRNPIQQSSPSQNLRSARGVGGKQAGKRPAVRETPPDRETQSERAARKASEANKDAERRAAHAAKEVSEVTKRKRVVGAKKNKRKKKQTKAKESKKKKTVQVHCNPSHSGKLADDDSPFEPDDYYDDVLDEEFDSLATPDNSHDSDSDSDSSQSALPEEGRSRAREVAAEELRRSAQAGTANPLRMSNSAREVAAEELRRSAQAGAANPLRTSNSAREVAAEELRRSAQAGAANPLRMSNSEEHGVGSMPFEAPTAQKNVVRRIVLFVKNTLFRQIKFVTSTKSFNEAFQKVLVEERPRNPYMFQLTYQGSFKTALNQKRSTCELSGKKIVIRAINTEFKNRGEEFFTFEEFCKLRRATTDRERKAFFWFFDSFLECVCGASVWNNAKTKQLISEARDTSGSKVVSVSDEAFALLLIDNYLEKWKTRAGEEDTARIEPVGAGAAATATEGENTRRKQTKTAGKYTGKAQGQCKWGGWSSEGIKQFNFLRKLVKVDREADKNCELEPKRMEKLLMDFCQTKAGVKVPQDDENLGGAGDGAHNNAVARAKALETVEAEWDSDED
jgi:hypothetical protein